MPGVRPMCDRCATDVRSMTDRKPICTQIKNCIKLKKRNGRVGHVRMSSFFKSQCYSKQEKKYNATCKQD
ncbi:hypothetical protein POVWA2_061170 [Plasmodium ovale wallikeri]|uniref:Uncharacterized protein n=1 Tax=Plasmodium ovale wallikeri TaxID=864142 RepID=A0A1A9A344_PLAOA|nr:hypothetical protein POVWA1_061630 [Plasmodium ovale wallikeri]SBT50899.1 hypothetical protein POVWA2_061170 [Plasmodium ovale wallikeri]